MEDNKKKNIKWCDASITREDYESQSTHRAVTLWFTGLSGSGKSTISNAILKKLFESGHRVYFLDADNLRHGLNGDLGFTMDDRKENIRRFGEVAKLFTDAGIILLAALISPLKEDRERVRNLFEKGDFIEIFVDCDISLCQERDPKGLYKKALNGEIPDFTGITSPYERPENPEIYLNTKDSSIEQCANIVLEHLDKKNYLKPNYTIEN